MAAPALLLACEDALDTVQSAVRAGLVGFTPEEVERIVASHVTVVLLRDAIALARREVPL